MMYLPTKTETKKNEKITKTKTELKRLKIKTRRIQNENKMNKSAN